MGRIGNFIRPRIQDLAMRQMDPMRPETLEEAEGRVLEVGFGTGLNLQHYAQGVHSVDGVDPLEAASPKVMARIQEASFPVEHHALRADGDLPFEDACFDTVVTTWTLCSIPDPVRALVEMHRVLKPGGRYLFIEHGRSSETSTARWQDRLNPIWVRLSDGCNMNRKIESLVLEGGFEIRTCNHFMAKGPQILANMFRGMAIRL